MRAARSAGRVAGKCEQEGNDIQRKTQKRCQHFSARPMRHEGHRARAYANGAQVKQLERENERGRKDNE